MSGGPAISGTPSPNQAFVAGTLGKRRGISYA